MPSLIRNGDIHPRVTKFTNCRLAIDGKLIEKDLWIDSVSGKILQDQRAFYEDHICPDQVIDLGGRILAPGFIEVQINGAAGFDFSVPRETKDEYDAGLRDVNHALIKMGITSYLPTLTSQKKEVYAKVLPSLGPSGLLRRAEDGAESLGAHVEGPFLSPGKNGIHSHEVLITAENGFEDLIDCYGAENICVDEASTDLIPVKMITAAPEVGVMLSLIPQIQSQGIIYSIGHSDATYEQAVAAVDADGIYDWTNGERIVKKGALLTLEGSDRLAGSSATLIECVNNFRQWAGARTVDAIAAVTETPAKMLGILGTKGTLAHGADADLVVLGEKRDENGGLGTLTVDQVWKFGVKVFDAEKA
ncbi:N-acetylglucosamine-6-phosphate deacetylase [Coccidioides immitis RMSCC 3703]|uniref:N-acetylglucosamine-6-phosphate deacetylase n=1 Tax=Coccidioides immitis RMSCC 3703 TaxID=454286 RepID=A0A0J8RC10_COCIT|nr:N-acetylglucosamine-6-phosphate deacetylase [Coccidioides immitis RMSCC 3703]